MKRLLSLCVAFLLLGPAGAQSASPRAKQPSDAVQSTADAQPVEPQPSPPRPPRSTYQAPIPPPPELARGIATKYANLSPPSCKKQLTARKAPVQFLGATPGIANPVRITGPLDGIIFLTGPKKSPFGIVDCRLLLVWLDLLPVLHDHNVTSVRVDNFYRKNARLPSRKKSQHAYGLATDITSFGLADGTTLEVERDFHGGLGQAVCGPDAVVHGEDTRGILLRNLVCDFARAGAFHHILTPNANLAHRNHLHLDIARGCSWFSLD